MSTRSDDHELLRRYAEQGSEDAFTELVTRHIDHVYSVALRETQEAHLASDLTQAAFILLARKAAKLKAFPSIAGWLFQTVRYAARNTRRSAWRREHYEKEAAAMIPTSPEPDVDSLWEQLAPLLNDALASLTASDRDVVTLRFFEKQSHEEIGTRLGVPETVARKRLSRAVERLRLFFARRGVTVAGTSLMVVMGTHSVSAAPAELAGVVTVGAVAKGATLSASVLALVQGASQAVVWTKAKVAAAVLAVTTLLCGGVVLSDSSRFRLDEVRFTTRFQSQRLAYTQPTEDSTNLFVLTSQRRRWGMGGNVVERLHRMFPQAVVHRLEVVDDRGDSFTGFFKRGTFFDGKGAKLELWELPLFPRRGTNLWLRFFELGKDGRERQAAEFEVPNPARGSYQQLTAEPLPATRTNADLEVTLARVEAGHPGAGWDAPVAPYALRYPLTCLTLSLRQEGRPRPPWTLGSVRIADATGNQWRTDLLETRSLPGQEARLLASFHGALWPSETAWRFELELVRTGEFAAADVLTVSGLQVPATNQVTALNQDHPLAGQLFRLHSLLGTEAMLPGHPAPLKQGYLTLQVEATGANVGQRVILTTVSDEQGRPVTIDGPPSRSGARLNYLLKAEPGAHSLTATFVRQESRRVAFVAHPTQVESNAGR